MGPPHTAGMSGRLARSAGLIGVATLASRALGLVRDVVQAWLFATGHLNDAFVLAQRYKLLEAETSTGAVISTVASVVTVSVVMAFMG